MRGEQNLQDTIRDGKRGDMRVEGKKILCGVGGGSREYINQLFTLVLPPGPF